MARVLGWAAAMSSFSLAFCLWGSSALAQGTASSPAEPSSAPTPATPPAMSAEPPSAAAEPAEPAPSRESLGPFLSVTFSPLHLVSPIFEAQIEGKLVPHFGAALIAGIGSIKSGATTSGLAEQKFSAYELGGQLVGYPLEPFESLQLGAEVLWIKVSTETINGQQITANAGGVAIGPLLGYKLITHVGFTFFAQGGFEYLVVKADAADTQGNTATAKQSAVIPLLNLNIGWSF